MAAMLTTNVPASFAQDALLSPNDVSILFPVPTSLVDLSNFISIADLADAGGAPLVKIEDFDRFVAIAEGDASKIVDAAGATAQIGFPEGTKDMKAWFIAGIRLDVGAPGLSATIMDAFGQIPQIRLIIQPVTERDGTLKIHDRAAHLTFSFALKAADEQETCPIPMMKKIEPNLPGFRAVLSDFVALRDGLAGGRFGGVQVTTTGPLDVHPGFKGLSQKPFRDAIEALLEKHLKSSQLGAMAAMGLPKTAPEPWIFLAMKGPNTGDLAAFPSPALENQSRAQLLRFFGSKKVLPEPKSDNQNDTMTRCFRLPNDRKGVSTAELFDSAATPARTIEVTGIIADPTKSHFFNTDCVSCHTETRLLRAKVPEKVIPGIVEAVLPKSRWNVRNFGWGPESAGFRPTITRRTATETDEVVKAANELL
ncbi:hypothetical protein ACG873_03815 [Mesorhizobium sp. AaZ16]|uniref:hypothetical protein n=1 Tax=Mesorhizobium sp. AaZ16 TaxID=3402289 RepID=UPI00374E7EE1